MHRWLISSVRSNASARGLLSGLVRQLLCLLVVVRLVLPAHAQRLLAPWQPDPVLSSLLVQQFVFSPEGYVWVATDAGVRRYDGYAAVPLAQLVQNEVAAPRGYVQLALDKASTLWIGADAGLFCFVPRTGQLMRLALPTAAGARAAVTALWHDARTQRLWVGYGRQQVAVLNPRASRVLAWRPPSGPPGSYVIRLAPSARHTVWVTTSQQVLVLDEQARLQHQLPQPAEALVPVLGTWPQQLVSPTALYELDATQGQLRERQRWLPDPHHHDDRFAPQLDAQGRPCEWLAAGQRISLRWPARRCRRLMRAPMSANPADVGTECLYRLQRAPAGLWWAFRHLLPPGGAPHAPAPALAGGLAQRALPHPPARRPAAGGLLRGHLFAAS